MTTNEPVTLSHFFFVVRRYSRMLLMAAGGIFVFFLVLAVVLYLVTPAVHVTRLPFRLEFRGVNDGIYPNGLKFSSNEIIAVPVLARVYEANHLSRLMTFREFGNSMAVIESNQAMEELGREYRAKLSDPKLGPVDRDRLEKEYRMRRDSISRSEFALDFVDSANMRKVPNDLAVKVLRDTLSTWASLAATEKGALEYRVPVVSAAILDPSTVELANLAIAAEILRAKITIIASNVEDLLRLPAAEVVRTKEGVGLTDVATNLEELVRFRLEPLKNAIRASLLDGNTDETRRFLQAQLDHARLRSSTANAKLDSLRQALRDYSPERSLPAGLPANAAPGAQSSDERLMPQLSEGFLDRLLTIVGDPVDRAYRQKSVEDIRTAALQALPLEQQVAYYRSELERLDRGAATSTPLSQQQARSELRAIYAETAKALTQMRQLYSLLSTQNLNPSTMLYSITAPAVTYTERSVSFRRLFLLALLTLLVVVPLLAIGAYLYEQVKGEDAEGGTSQQSV